MTLLPARELGTLGTRLPHDPLRRRAVRYRFGAPRALHLGDYLGCVRALRVLAADPSVELTVTFDAPDAEARAAAAQVAAVLVGCGLGSVAFETTDPADVVDLTAAPLPDGGPVIHDLRHPRVPMGALGVEGRGVVRLMDTRLRLAAVVRGAKTDLDPMLGYDPQLRPGVANLAVILGALTGRTPIAALYGLHGSGALKRAVTDAVIETLRPVQQRADELLADPGTLTRLVRS